MSRRVAKISTLSEQFEVPCEGGWAVGDLVEEIATKRGLAARTVCLVVEATCEEVARDRLLSDTATWDFIMVIREVCSQCHGDRKISTVCQCDGGPGTGVRIGYFSSLQQCPHCGGSGSI